MKIRTLKSKISLIYIFLVGIIAVIGISSVMNLYRLSRSVDGLMIDNYKSIKASSQMLDALESQNTAMLDYMYSDNNRMVDMYFKSSSSFYSWYNIEANNITETGEKEIVDNINSAYNGYITQFSRLQNIKVRSGKKAAVDYYNTNLVGQYSSVKNELQQLTLLNEKAMFRGKDRVTDSTKESMYLIMLLSIVLVILGFVISGYFINKFLKPIYVLKENIKSIREGNLEQQTDINTDDEIGDLAQEFKKMTQRLMQFEKSTKGKLLEEKNRSLAIVKSISDPLIVLGTDYKVVLINNACEMFFGINEEKSVGKHFLEVIKNGDIYDHIAENSSASEDKYIPKIISIMSEGKEFFFDIIVTKIRDYNSDITGFVVIFQNVTKLKKLERTKTEFVSTISHEFKTPLTSIMMGASLIKSSDVGYINEKQSEIVKAIEEDTERLSALVNDMIQLSKIESDKNIYNFEPCSIFGIVENCSRSFSELAVSKEVSIITEVDEDMPKVYADYEKISWVLNNLLSNAVKCTNAGDTITVTAKTLKNNMMQVSVKDTGIGIPEEYRERIFDKFFKVQSGSGEIKGTGLGLAIAKEIVTVHKGEIWCVSKVDEGSEFIFTIPLAVRKG